MAINGMDCECNACCCSQCSCGCDWTTTKEARLQDLNAELLAACEEAMLEFNDGYTAEGKGIIVEAMASAKESEGE